MKCVIYARVDEAERATEHLTEQLAACRKFARENGFEVVSEFSEMAPEGQTDRPQLSALRRLLAHEKIGAVVVCDLNRLSRKASDLLTLYREFDRVGTGIYYLRRQSDSALAGPVPWREDARE
jgi:DNA invertase Pin-like site-specific DNA recombinase